MTVSLINCLFDNFVIKIIVGSDPMGSLLFLPLLLPDAKTTGITDTILHL